MICPCCGSSDTLEQPVLWKSLIDEWQLAGYEVAYIDRQQGLQCAACGSNLRSMTLARAVMSCFGYAGLLVDFLRTPMGVDLRVLEINEAGNLHQFLKDLPNHLLTEYPDVDMMSLSFEDNVFDLVIHSDTLEHVPHPVRGLSECRRVLKPGGFCAFTVPLVVDRLTRSRKGLPPSYHGSPTNPADCLVHTEYGADAWKDVLLAGFVECRLFSWAYPASQALVAVRSRSGEW
jgi:SAM-dependent methyltransferase